MKIFLTYIILATSLQLFIGCGYTSEEEFSQPNSRIHLTTSKSIYFEDENITVTFDNIDVGVENLIAIYPKDSSFDYKNILRREDINGVKDGTVVFESIPKGVYEVRVFSKGSLNLEATITFEVGVSSTLFTMYEDAEEKISANWIQKLGHYKPIRVEGGYRSRGALVLTPEWIDNATNVAEYHLDMNNSKQKILEMDMGGLTNYRLPNLPDIGYIQHYKVGLYVQTTKGRRVMIWDSFFTHGGVEPFSTDYGNGNIWLSYPSPVEHVRGYDVGIAIDKWEHFRVDVEKELQKLEPNNTIIRIDTFLATGGFIDNLKLSLH